MRITVANIIVGLFLFILISQFIIRLIRRYYKFPIPAFMVNLIDNPIRHKIQPPLEMPIRHRIEPGMTVLEIGPGNGVYTVGTAQRVGTEGKIVTVDIQHKVIKRLNNKVHSEKITIIDGLIANVHHLPFKDGVFDAIYMIAVIGEIPRPENALKEFYRVLEPSGMLAFSELLPDPDYPLAKTLANWAAQANFRLKEKQGNFFMYTLVFDKGNDENG